MKITHVITNRAKYKATIIDIDLSQLKAKNKTQFEGEIFITTKHISSIPCTFYIHHGKTIIDFGKVDVEICHDFRNYESNLKVTPNAPCMVS